MKKRITAPVIFALMAIMLLLALAVFLKFMLFHDGSSSLSLQLGESATLQLKGTEESVPAYGEEGYVEPEHCFLFVGDSRTVGMQNALAKKDQGDSCFFVAKDGQGYSWFQDEGLFQVREILDSHSDITVIFNLGVNDLENVTLYKSLYQELKNTYASPDFYFLSVNPVFTDQLALGNEDIEYFNNSMSDLFQSAFLDSYHDLEDQFVSTDGLHYTEDTYCLIHHYVIEQLLKN